MRCLGGAVPAALLLLALDAGPIGGQAAGADPSPVIRTPASVRTLGLNGAGAAFLGDAGSVFTNPVGIATIRHIAIEGQLRRAPEGALLASAALAWRLGQFDVGFGARRFDFGADPAAYLGGGVARGTPAHDVLGSATFLYRRGFFALGATGKYARRTVDDTWVDGASGDVGLAIAVFDIMALAFAVQNVGGNWRDTASFAMPPLTRLGFMMNYVDPQESFRLLSTVEVQWPAGSSARAVVGLEAGVVLGGVGLIARAGFGGREPVLATTRWTYGGTLRVGVWNVDYAYRATDLLDEPAHYFGTRFTL